MHDSLSNYLSVSITGKCIFSRFLTDADVGFERRKPVVSRMRQSANNNITPSDPHAVVVSQTRKVRTSLQKIARQQDEIFEL